MASTEICELSPSFTLRPESATWSIGDQLVGVRRSWRSERLTLGMMSRGRRGSRWGMRSDACFSNTHLLGSRGGHATDTPVRLTLRQNSTPIRTSSPLANRMLRRGSFTSTE